MDRLNPTLAASDPVDPAAVTTAVAAAEPRLGAPDRAPAGWRARLAEVVGIDLRSLAVLRVGLAVLVVCDLAARAPDLAAHYGDGGVLPRAAALVWLPVEAHLSIYTASGQPWFQAGLFALAALAAAALAAGWHTRAASMLSWYLLFALQARNPAVGHGGDNVLRLVMFWAMFLPLGARWSRDRAAGRLAAPPGPQVVSAAALAARLQLCLVYWVTAAFKWNPAWLGGGAIATALRVDRLSTSWGRWLLNFPRLLRWVTRGTLAFEILGPLAAWTPFYSGPVRSVVVLGFVLFHLCGLRPALRLGSFPWVCAVAWALFLPSWFWERLHRGRLGRVMDALDRSDFRGEEAWRARQAHRTGSTRRGRRLGDGLAALLLAYVLLLNLRELGLAPFGPLLPATEWISQSLSLHQRWNMFAPSPPLDDGWIVAAGRTRDGRAVDAWRGSALDLSRPEPLETAYGNFRWTKYLGNLRQPDHVFHRRLFGNYLCRRWNSAHAGAERLESLTLVYMLELTVPPDRKLPAQPLLLFAQRCPDG
jgi:hypothetical protein